MSSGIYRYSQYIVIQLFNCTPYFIQKSFSRYIMLHLPSSFPFPGSTPECIVWYVLVLRTYYPWGHGPEKRDLYDPIKPCTRPVQTFRHFPAKKKKRGPPIHSRVQLHSFEDLYGVGFRIYIPSGSNRSIVIPLCRMMLRALGQVNPITLRVLDLTSYARVYQVEYQRAMLHVSVFDILRHCSLYSMVLCTSYSLHTS